MKVSRRTKVVAVRFTEPFLAKARKRGRDTGHGSFGEYVRSLIRTDLAKGKAA